VQEAIDLFSAPTPPSMSIFDGVQEATALFSAPL